MRGALLALVLLCTAAPAAGAEVPAGLGPDGLVFTMLGSGSDEPREGLPAYRVRLGILDLGRFAALPSGEVAFAGGEHQRALLAGADGRVHLLPPLRDVTHLSAAGDGALYAVERDEIVHRLAPGAARWERLFDPVLEIERWRSFEDEVDSIAALVGGGFAFTSDRGAFRVGDDGAVAPIALPRGTRPLAVAAGPGGEAIVGVADARDHQRIVVVPPGGAPRELPFGGDVSTLAALPGGGYLRARGSLRVLGADGVLQARIGVTPGLGRGDGGPAAGAALLAFGSVAERGGTVLLDEIAPRGLDAFEEEEDGVAVPLPFFGGATDLRVRAFAAPGSALPLAALAAPTYDTVAAGTVTVQSTFAGRATVVVRHRGREVMRAGADVPAGAALVALPEPPPRGDLRLSLEVAGADGRVAGGVLPVVTSRRLALARVHALADRFNAILGEDGFRPVVGCRRTAAARARCDFRVRVRGRARCRGRFVVVQRPDGRHASIEGGGRACRAG